MKTQYIDIHGHLNGTLPFFFKFIPKINTPEDFTFKDLKKSNLNGFIVNAVGDFTKILKLPLNPYKYTLKQLKKIINNAKKENIKILYGFKDFEKFNILGLDKDNLDKSKEKNNIENTINKNRFVILGIEGADFIENKPQRVYDVYEIGVRVITLIHFNENCIGTPCMSFGGKKNVVSTGLKDMGKEVINIMNNLGIIIDVAHADEKTAIDIVNRSISPVLCSHTASNEISPFKRHISDKLASEIADKGGVIGLWAYNYKGKGIKNLDEFKLHLKHFKKLVGASHIAIGTDINASPQNMERYKNPYDFDSILFTLKDAGFKESEIESVLYKNFLRVCKDVLK